MATKRRVTPAYEILAGPAACQDGSKGYTWFVKLRGTSYPWKAYQVTTVFIGAKSVQVFYFRELGRSIENSYRATVRSRLSTCSCKGFAKKKRCKHLWLACRL